MIKKVYEIPCSCCHNIIAGKKAMWAITRTKHSGQKLTFCSKDCRRNFKGKLLIRPCAQCNKEIRRYGNHKRNNHFCSRRCWGIFREAGRRKDRYCAECGEKIARGSNKYCSHACMRKNNYDKTVKLWLSGALIYDTESAPGTVKRYLLEQCGNKCPRCDWGEVNKKTGKVPLTLDHIDGNCKNNSPGNVRILCPNCHSLTETYGGLNKGNGKRNKRKEYRSYRKSLKNISPV